MITLGDKGVEVSKLQKLLSMVGYDLIIDGDFGDKTLRSLKAFQKKYGLKVDGIAGPMTFEALKAAQKRTSKEKSGGVEKDYLGMHVNTDYSLELNQYIRQIFEKDKVFIHFTVSGPDSKNVIKYWDGNSPRIATSFVVSGRGSEDGAIYEAFNPDYWSYHLGVKGSKGKLDKKSIGIEICLWGRLTKKGDKFQNVYGGSVPEEEVFDLGEKWRGSRYFHKISEKQLEELEKLLCWIVKEYNIPIQNEEFDNNWFEYNEDLVKKGTPGIWNHTSVRKDKQDMYPDPNLIEVLNRVKNKFNND